VGDHRAGRFELRELVIGRGVDELRELVIGTSASTNSASR